jgi:hypothetical protein
MRTARERRANSTINAGPPHSTTLAGRGERRMIRFTTENGQPTCVAELGNRVAVYLDNDVVSELSRPGDLRTRFIGAIRRRGTLLFSFANAIEVSSSDAVWSFLDEIGPEWVPLALSPWQVAEREKAGAGRSSPVSERFIESYFKERAYDLSPNGIRLLDLSAETFFRLSAVASWAQKGRDTARKSMEIDEAIRKRIADERTAYDANADALDKSLPPIPFDANRPATFVLIHLLRTLVIEAKAYQLRPHDGLDLCHAVLAASYGELATLDEQWKRRVKGLPKPHELATVYYRPQVGELVERLEALVAQAAVLSNREHG